MTKILLVEDDDLDAGMIRDVLPPAFEVRRAKSLAQARKALADFPMDLVLLDYRLPDGDGVSLLSDLRQLDPDVPVVFVTALNDARTGIAAVRNGAREFLVKDGTYLDELPLVVEKVLKAVVLEARHAALQAELARDKSELALLRRQESQGRPSQLIGGSQTMGELRSAIERAARTSETVLITGETGTGKELVARAVHEMSGRRAAPFVAVNCAAVPESLIEAEFFGYAKAAFTGANRDKKGLFEAAGEGSLFLDEIGELPLVVQSKLIRVLQEREFTPVGSTRPKVFPGRLLAATNRDLKAASEDGTFRQDLYYRLHVVPIVVPPLREHREDIPALVAHFIQRFNERNGTTLQTLTPQAMRLLEQAPWPGNIRQLENLITQVLVNTEPSIDGAPTIPERLEEELHRGMDSEAGRILRALETHRWNRQAAASELQISRTTLWRKMLKYNLVTR